MKTRNTIFAFGAALMVSLVSLNMPRTFHKAAAEEIIDVGTITIDSVRDAASNSQQIYLIPTVENTLPDSWDNNHRYHPVGEDDGVFVNGEKDLTAYIKHGYIGIDLVPFYIELTTPASKDDLVEIKGTWSCPTDGTKTYKFTFEPYAIKWNSTKWEVEFVIPELEPYDKVSLTDTCFDDKYCESFDNTGLVPNCWNTFPTKAENTKNSFAFEFAFESYAPTGGDSWQMNTTLTFKIGSPGKYDEGHYYKLDMNNTWGPTGVMVFYEMNETSIYHKTQDLSCDLKPGSRHIIEFGSIYVKNSSDTYNYVIYDGVYLYQEVVTPYNNERSTKVGYYYGGNNIFVGSTTTQKANTQTLKYNHISDNKKGIYLDGTSNSIPSGWDIKGAPVNKYNALYNGQPLFNYGVGTPMVKVTNQENSAYYLDLDNTNVPLKAGDVITLSGEFHFFADGKAYSMSVIPVSILVEDSSLSEINNIYDFLYDRIEHHCNHDYYDQDKIDEINLIVSQAETDLPTATTMKELWEKYDNYILQLNAIPLNPEKVKEILDNAKAQAIAQLNNSVDPDLYDETNLAIAQGYVNDAIAEIESDSTTTVDRVQEILEETLALVAGVKTIQQALEEKLLEPGNDIPTIGLESYDIVTTTDLCAVGDLTFRDSNENSYRSGGYDDITTRLATSNGNSHGNLVFQFNYESDDPSARYIYKEGQEDAFEAGAQIYIRMRSHTDTDAYRFDIAVPTDDGEENSGVALSTLRSDIAVGRIIYNSKFKKNTPYKIECGAIDLANYSRTFLFMKIDGEMVIKTIVDSIDDPQPTIRIMDSLVKNPHYAKMSAIEEGTSKTSISTLVGRLILDNASDKNALLMTLKDNNIETGTVLYPVEKGAFKVNGVEIDSSRASTRITKTGQNKYLVNIDDYEFQNGDKITIGGRFGTFNSATLTKTIYRFFETTFVFNGDSNTWSQDTPTDHETIVYEAEETIKYAVDLSEYSLANQKEINDLIDYYVGLIGTASDEEIASIVEQALKQIKSIHTIFDDYKIAAKDELAAYKSINDYRDEEKAQLNQILNDAYSEIDACGDTASVDGIVLKTKAAIDELKTASQRDAEDLKDAKKAATVDVQAYASLLEMERYSDENAELLSTLTYQALADIENATSIEQVNNIVAKFKEDIKAVQTKDGSTFDGEKYIEAQKAEDNNFLNFIIVLIPVMATIGMVFSIVSGSLVFIALVAAVIIIIIIVKKRKVKKQ